MQRKMMLATVVALVLVVSLASAAMAAGPGPAANGEPVAGQQWGAGNGLYIDLDGDGQCDEYATRTPAQDGTGSQWGQGGFQRNPTSGVGSPLGAQDGTGAQVRQGGRWSR